MIAGETKLGILGSITLSFIYYISFNARTKCMHPGMQLQHHDACRVLPSDGDLVGVTRPI